MENTITIRTIETRTSKKSGQTYWQIEDMQGVKYTCFEASIYEKIQPGKTYNVNVEISKDGKFRNIREPVVEVTGQVEAVKLERTRNCEATHPPAEKKAGSWRSPSEIIACELTKIASENKLSVGKIFEDYNTILSKLNQ